VFTDHRHLAIGAHGGGGGVGSRAAHVGFIKTCRNLNWMLDTGHAGSASAAAVRATTSDPMTYGAAETD
jgi:hypothetical protein